MSLNLSHALRQLAKSPGFTAVAILIVALCRGVNLTISALIDSILLRPLPFPNTDRLATLFNTYPKAGVDREGSSLTNNYDRRGKIPAFSSLAIIRPDSGIVGEPGSPPAPPRRATRINPIEALRAEQVIRDKF
jgi:hypothetical protein